MANEPTIDDLQYRIDELEDEESKLREQLAKTQLEQVEGHLDDLQVQVRLGAMEIRDRLEPIVEKVRNQVLEARSQIDAGSTTATDAAAAIRSGLEQAWTDMRAALAEAKKIITS